MDRYTIGLVAKTAEAQCPECGERSRSQAGFGVFSKAHVQPVCRKCGKRSAPALVALLDLAHAAERVGKSFRHMLTPPMESLLDLAHAAENYSHTSVKLHSG